MTINNNNSQSRVVYLVTLESATKDFEIESDSISLEPGQSKTFPVKFYARISKEVTARLTFKGSKDAVVSINPMVFDLKSRVIGRRSTSAVDVSDVPLYEKTAKDITIYNPFDKDVIFSVFVEHKPSVRNKKLNKYKSTMGAYRRQEEDKIIIPSFFVMTKKIHIPKKKTGKVRIVYIPTTYETHLCNLILVDERSGEI